MFCTHAKYCQENSYLSKSIKYHSLPRSSCPSPWTSHFGGVLKPVTRFILMKVTISALSGSKEVVYYCSRSAEISLQMLTCTVAIIKMSTSYCSPQIEFLFFPENKGFSPRPRNCFIRKPSVLREMDWGILSHTQFRLGIKHFFSYSVSK